MPEPDDRPVLELPPAWHDRTPPRELPARPHTGGRPRSKILTDAEVSDLREALDVQSQRARAATARNERIRRLKDRRGCSR